MDGNARSPQLLANKQNSVCHSNFRQPLQNPQIFFESLSRHLEGKHGQRLMEGAGFFVSKAILAYRHSG